jgi:Tol biopolymer transport system component
MRMNLSRLRSLTLAVTAAICLAIASAAEAVPEGSTTLLSRPAGLGALPSGLVNDSGVGGPRSGGVGSATNVSEDGRFVAFVSRSDGMSSEDDDGVLNVYVRDTFSGAVTLVSRASGPSGEPAHKLSMDPSISADGIAVAFVSDAALVPADTNGNTDVYVRRLDTGVTVLVSREDGFGGGVGNGTSQSPSISGNGNRIAFETSATNLDDGDTTATYDVHVRDLAAGQTMLASRATSASGAIGDADSSEPALSADGTKVAFRSYATNFDTTYDTNGTSDIYRRDLGTGATVLVSRVGGSSTAAGNGASSAPAIDADGSHVAFETMASNLHPADPNTISDIYVRTFLVGTTVPVSRADGLGGATGNRPSRGPAISADGNSVAFTTGALNLGDGDTDDGNDVHVRRISTGETLLASRQAGAAGEDGDNDSEIAALSGDGSWVAFETGADNLSTLDDDDFAQAYMRELDGDERLLQVSRPAGAAGAVVGGVGNTGSGGSSADGRYIVVMSRSDALLDNRHQQVLVKDTVTGEISLASRANGPEGAPADADTTQGRISADGTRVSFISRATNLVDGLPSTTERAYVRDLRTGTTEVVSRAPDGSVPPDAGVFQLDLSGDGQVVAFTTHAALVPDDTGFEPDVYVRDLRTGAVELANRVDGAGGAEGNGFSQEPSLDHDGDRVAFDSNASNLGDGDTDGDLDVHVRDLASGRTFYASRADGPEGAEGDSTSSWPSISADGMRVAFRSLAANLGDGDTDHQRHAHVRDLATGRTLLGSANSAGVPTPGVGDLAAELTADGRRILFGTADPLDPTDVNGLGDLYERDLASGSVTLVTRADGAAGAAGNEASYAGVAPDADGSCVAFTTRATNLVTAGYPTSDFSQVYQRAVEGTCGEASGGGGGDYTNVPPDTTAPVVSRFRATRTRFRVARRATALTAATGRVRAGTVLRYQLSEAARVTLTVQRELPGRRAGGRCLKPRPRLASKPACIRLVRAGRLVRSGRVGPNTVSFSGRIGRRALATGRYRVTLVAMDAAGNRSRPARVLLRIVR